MIGSYSLLKSCENRILRSVINVVGATKSYNLKPSIWCNWIWKQPTLSEDKIRMQIELFNRDKIVKCIQIFVVENNAIPELAYFGDT